MLTNDDCITQAATLLSQRRKYGKQGPRLPESCRPKDIDSALAVQAMVSEQLDEQVGGWKCALPIQAGIVVAPIYAGSICTDIPCPAWARNGEVRIEPELAFVLGRDLLPRDTPYAQAEVDAAIDRVHLALELIDSRYNNPADVSFAENLADGLLNQGLFIGPQLDNFAESAIPAMTIRLTDESGHQTDYDGRHPNKDPRAPLYWLVDFLRAKGVGLQAGQAVITGSYAGSIGVPLNQHIRIRFGEHGELTVRFIPK